MSVVLLVLKTKLWSFSSARNRFARAMAAPTFQRRQAMRR
jgi:hypothetical protein